MQTKDSSAARVEFVPPAGEPVPEREDPSKPFDLVCSFMPGKGGKVCMVKYGNTDMPGYDDGDENETKKPEVKPDYSQMAQGLMGQPPAGASQGY